MEYFQQFARFLNKGGYIGQFRKVEKEVGGVKKLESVCKKLITIRPTRQLGGHPTPEEK